MRCLIAPITNNTIDTQKFAFELDLPAIPRTGEFVHLSALMQPDILRALQNEASVWGGIIGTVEAVILTKGSSGLYYEIQVNVEEP